jgi:lysophospholipase L1-like esterase
VALAAALSTVVGTVACDESPTAATSTTDGGSSGSDGSGGGGSPGTSVTVTATRFLAFGDSVTAGEVTAPLGPGAVSPLVVVPAASYPAQLQERLRTRYRSQAAQIAVVNAGRAELTSVGMPRLADLLANAQRDAQALLLLNGGEDLLNFGANAVAAAAVAMNDQAREGRRRGLRVFIALVPPSIPGRQRSIPDAAIRAYNDQLAAIARGEGAVLVDLYAALSQDVSRYIGADGWHPNEAGYRRIADEFLARIAAELEPR